MRLEPFSIQNP